MDFAYMIKLRIFRWGIYPGLRNSLVTKVLIRVRQWDRSQRRRDGEDRGWGSAGHGQGLWAAAGPEKPQMQTPPRHEVQPCWNRFRLQNINGKFMLF